MSDPRIVQVPPEDEAALAELVSEAAAWARLWIEAMLVLRDIDNAWKITTVGFSQALAREWLTKHHGDLFDARSLQWLTEVLAELDPACPFVNEFREAVPLMLQAALPGLDASWAVGVRPRPIAAGLEQVLFVDAGDQSLYIPDGVEMPGPTHTFLMQEAEDRWLVANINRDTPA